MVMRIAAFIMVIILTGCTNDFPDVIQKRIDVWSTKYPREQVVKDADECQNKNKNKISTIQCMRKEKKYESMSKMGRYIVENYSRSSKEYRMMLQDMARPVCENIAKGDTVRFAKCLQRYGFEL